MFALPLLAIFAVALAKNEAPLHESGHYVALFNRWSKAHHVNFEEVSFAEALENFASNCDFIEEHNAEYRQGMHTYTLGHNEYSHMSWEQFRAQKLGFTPTHRLDFGAFETFTAAPEAADSLPDIVDWTEKGAVTSVKNQGMCGSCWTFSAVGALEGALAIKTGQLIDLSEEQILDCDKVDKGCMGGEMETAYEWVAQNGGVCAAEDYPYTGILPPFKTCKSVCKPVPGTKLDDKTPWVKVNADEKSFMTALHEKGPLAVAIEADQQAFQFYQDGVFTAVCGSNLDHGVTLVGYGTDEDTKLPYFKIKNSWGATWGSNGFIKVVRPSANIEGDDDECGVLLDGIYPQLAMPSPAFNELESLKSTAQRVASQSVDTLLDMWRGSMNSAFASDCGGATNIDFDNVTVEPAVPKRGKPVTMAASGVLTKPVSSGKYSLKVTLSGVKMYSHSGSVCGEQRANLPLGLGHITLHGLPCAAADVVEPGQVNYGLVVNLPGIAPPGQYTIELSAVDQDQAALMCLKADLHL